MPAGDRLEELAGQLDSVAEGLVDTAMTVLREALSDRSDEVMARARSTEKLINRARSSVEKAARLARQAAGAEEEPTADDYEP